MFGDTCYSWWVMAMLRLIDPQSIRLVGGRKSSEYLLNKTQHKLMGGFGKDTQAFTDPFHSFLALASFSFMKNSFDDVKFEEMERVCEIDPQLVITRNARDFMESLW